MTTFFVICIRLNNQQTFHKKKMLPQLRIRWYGVLRENSTWARCSCQLLECAATVQHWSNLEQETKKDWSKTLLQVMTLFAVLGLSYQNFGKTRKVGIIYECSPYLNHNDLFPFWEVPQVQYFLSIEEASNGSSRHAIPIHDINSPRATGWVGCGSCHNICILPVLEKTLQP